MIRSTALLLLASCLLGATQKKPDSLAGTYVAWMFVGGRPQALDGSHGVSQKLSLTLDGTYTFQTESSVMVSLSALAKGLYMRQGETLTLRGEQTATTDDGYKKGTTRSSQTLRLKVKDEMLVLTEGKRTPLYFRKVGEGPPPLPAQFHLKHSDTVALALIEKTQKVYSGLKSIKVTGQVESKGAGFVAEHARFKVLFQNPSKFRFEAASINGKDDSNRVEITWGGGKKCWWYSEEFGESTDRSLGNALSIVGVTFGPEVNLLASLLLPMELERGGLSARNVEATLLPTETVNGKKCNVLQLRGKDADVTKLWVEESNGMIVRLREEARAITVTFESHPNISISSKELRLNQRSGRT